MGGRGQKCQNIYFSESGHVAYQLKHASKKFDFSYDLNDTQDGHVS